QVVGLDIGTSAVRAAELEFGSGAPILVAFGQVGLPPGAIVDGEVQDLSAVSDAIARLWQNGKFQSKSVVVGIAGLRAITREVDLPWVPDEDVDSAVRFQSEEVIPFPPDKTILSAQVLSDDTASDGTKTRRVLVAAAHRDLVDGVVNAAEQAGLIVEGVDLVSSALVRALGDPSVAAERPEAIVSIGAGLTVVVVHQHGRPQFVRTIGTGGNAATAAVASALDLPLVDAEGLKRRLGEASAQVTSAEGAVQPAIAELVGEIRNSVQYFATLPGRAPIARVLLTGGGARLRGLVKELRAQVRIPVEHVSPLDRLDLSRIDLDPEQAASIEPVLATPIGLALPEPNPSVKKFNLVPPEVTQRAFERQVARKAFVAAGVVVLLLVAASAGRFLQVHKAQNGVSDLHTAVAGLNAQIPKYDKVVAINNELRTAKGQVATLGATAVDWSAVVSQLGTRVPAGLSVNTFTGTSLAGAGTTASTTATATATASSTGSTPVAGSIGSLTVGLSGNFPSSAHFDPVAQWIDNLTASPMFSPPGVSAVANAPAGGSTTVTFSSTLWLLPTSNLIKNAGF
ncbi:MAG TPA: type IV pilus assembly protein PilM, partial [Acidimicrobiales bacterium]|nr:type IV pilus assembly protein PilM [Acidimicrobiales bacterium]